mgnify:CR=1 FL=1
MKICGYLEKRGGPTNPAFKKRFIVLTHHGNIRYFKNDTSTAKLGCFTVIDSELDTTGTTNILKINTSDRDWVLQFVNENARAKWVFAIQDVVNGQFVNDTQLNGNGSKQMIENLTQQYTTLAQTARLPSNLPVDSTRLHQEPRRSLVGGLRRTNTYTIPQLLEIQRVDIPKDPPSLLNLIPQLDSDVKRNTESVKVACVTWNLAEYLPDMKELDFLKQITEPEDVSQVPSILVVVSSSYRVCV